MSGQFVKITTSMLKEITDVYEQQIYIYLKKNTNIAGFCSRSYSVIADATGICRKKVIDVINALAKRGIIRKEYIRVSSGYGVNHYYICDTPSFWQLSTDLRKDMLKNYTTEAPDNLKSAACSFVKAYHSIIEDKELPVIGKSLYIALLRYKNSLTGLCCPSLKRLAADIGCCIKTVHKYINLLVSRGLISKETYFNSSTGKRALSRYTLYHLPGSCSTPAASRKHKEKKEYKKYVSGKKQKGTDRHRTVTDQEVRELLNYNDTVTLASEQGIEKKYIDIAFDIIRHEINSPAETFTFKDEELPHMLLRSTYEKLTPYEIISAINIYLEQYSRITNHEGYLKILLYRIKYQSVLEEANTVNMMLYS